ncbi:DUF1256 domain-containing protein [Paenibacillus humicola]|uniref:DUF1256 domain-containing protein n=1 Tax=Paenibacillus humicola TaxID=3110540 RepID=UPI00237A1B6A|nr:DUF1256 domain-containing protein [Paenibacillus humicola]
MGIRPKGRTPADPGRRSGVRTGIEGLRVFFESIAARHPDPSGVAAFCIGTDRSTGDAFGPLTGTLLRAAGWPIVVGTLERPCDSERYEGALRGLPEGVAVVAFDACLGRPDPAGRYSVAAGPLYPARATGGTLPPVGDYSVAAIVGPLSAKPYYTLQRASLHEVMGMAREAADAFCAAWGHTAAAGNDLRSFYR